ncbi:Regulator of G-protein signaling 9-binding protein [Portunus trituberculatus]|uniref:Regulator of G-protein signaling 9-binding protein n=1 Tax=Portunus trituberculatus TaxID=210409 RepID=A0A5B7CV84_PORTR|nr:Regulator of G-protein signaling 9-binding protein [Portunus trituberculatus]
MLIRELNRETSNYRHLAVGVGGSGDCEQLRDELKRSRRRAQDLARQAKNKLNPYLLETDPVRPEVARLWRILFCCIRVLEQEMLRTLTLQHTFGLHLGPVGLINTGVHEYGGSHRPGPASLEALELPLDDRQALERAEVNQLQKELIDLRNLINVMESSLDLKAWVLDEITEKQLLAAINDDSPSFHDNNESGCSEAESPCKTKDTFAHLRSVLSCGPHSALVQICDVPLSAGTEETMGRQRPSYSHPLISHNGPIV